MVVSHIRIENGLRALVLGCGTSGAAAALFLHSRGWDTTIVDTAEHPSGLKLFEEVESCPKFVCTEFSEKLVGEKLDLLVLSPGLSPEFSKAAPLVKAARALGADVVGEIELFARELNRLASYRGYRPIVIGITGTNGKTTTTVLTGKMAGATKSVEVAGNIGPSALLALDRHLQANTLPEVWVLELSSFQLQTTKYFKPVISAILNVTPDHLNRHHTMENYALSKARVFANQDAGSYCVLNAEDEICRRLADRCRAQIIWFSAARELEKGAFVKDGYLTLATEKGGEISLCRRNRRS